MPFNLILKEEAVSEINDTFSYYEEQKSGLGLTFINELEEHLFDIIKTPHHYSFFLHQDRFRNHSLKKFLSTIIYEVIDNDVIVYAVHNTYKNPDSLFKRLPL